MKKSGKAIRIKRVFGKVASMILAVMLLCSATAFAQAKTISYHLAPKLNYTSIVPTSTRYNDLWLAYSDGKDHLINSNGDIVCDLTNKDYYNFNDGVFIENEDTSAARVSRYEENGTLTPAPDFGLGGHGMMEGYIYNLDTQKAASVIFDFSEDHKQLEMMEYGEWFTAFPADIDESVLAVYVVKNFAVVGEYDEAQADYVGMAAYANGKIISGSTYYKSVAVMYQDASNVQNTVLGLQNSVGKWAITEYNGTAISGYEYDDVSVFATKHNITAVKKGGVWGFVNNPITNTSTSPSQLGSFTDVSATAYYGDAVKWAVDKKITSGTSATTFSPDATCTDAQILTFLWRASGQPEPTKANPFTDVKDSDYYYKAALWASEKGLMAGTTLEADAPCTRSMVVTYLWKLAGQPTATKAASFTDVSSNADYAKAVAWAVEQGITSGTSATTFEPEGICTRGQIVTFLFRAMGK